MGSLANQQVLEINARLAGMTIENDLRRAVRDNIRRLRDMGSYRGRRHAMGMPVRGQRTRTQVCGCCASFFSFLVENRGWKVSMEGVGCLLD